MNLPDNYVDSTWFAINKSNASFADYSRVQNTKLACASLLKPLYMWSAYHMETFDDTEQDWSQLVQQAITLSSNAVTTEVWEKYGAVALLTELKTLTAINFFKPGITSWGGVTVDADMVAHSYGAMRSAAAYDKEAAKLVELMKKVSYRQTFGLKKIAARHYGVSVNEVGVKCGWYIDESLRRLRTHAVVIVELGDGKSIGFVILTSIKVSSELVRKYLRTYSEGTEVLSIHEQISGNVMRNELTSLLALSQ